MRNVFGSTDRIEETTRKRRETHKEAGGAGAGSEASATGAGWEKGVPAGQVSAMRGQLARGVYTGPEDPLFVNVCKTARSAAA